MADQPQLQSQTNAEAAQDFLDDLKGRARDADTNGNLFMLDVYNDILKIASDVTQRALARVEREERALLNKREKALRKEAFEKRKAEREAAQSKRA